MRNFEGEIGVLFHEQDGQALLTVDFDNFLENRFNQERGEAEGRLVEHQELGLRHERAANGQHLLLAAAQGAGNLLFAFLQAWK